MYDTCTQASRQKTHSSQKLTAGTWKWPFSKRKITFQTSFVGFQPLVFGSVSFFLFFDSCHDFRSSMIVETIRCWTTNRGGSDGRWCRLCAEALCLSWRWPLVSALVVKGVKPQILEPPRPKLVHWKESEFYFRWSSFSGLTKGLKRPQVVEKMTGRVTFPTPKLSLIKNWISDIPKVKDLVMICTCSKL